MNQDTGEKYDDNQCIANAGTHYGRCKHQRKMGLFCGLHAKAKAQKLERWEKAWHSIVVPHIQAEREYMRSQRELSEQFAFLSKLLEDILHRIFRKKYLGPGDYLDPIWDGRVEPRFEVEYIFDSATPDWACSNLDSEEPSITWLQKIPEVGDTILVPAYQWQFDEQVEVVSVAIGSPSRVWVKAFKDEDEGD